MLRHLVVSFAIAALAFAFGGALAPARATAGMTGPNPFMRHLEEIGPAAPIAGDRDFAPKTWFRYMRGGTLLPES